MLYFSQCLRAAHTKASSAYMDGNPIMSDADFDLLESWLFPKGAPPNVLTVSKLHQRLVQHEHFVPSLSKLKTQEDILRWLQGLPKSSYTVSAKLDGVHVTLTYKEGVLVQAATRGKHTQGLSVLPHTEFFKGLPSKSQTKRHKLSGTIEGELILPNTVFAEHKDTLFSLYKNPRAAVAGLLRADNPAGHLLAHCRFFAFEHYQGEPQTYSHADVLKSLVAKGFSIPYALQFTRIKDITEERLTNFITECKRILPFAVDGAVLRHNTTAPEDARIVGKYPHHARAFKLPAETSAVETRVIGISWQVTRTGLYSPVVRIEPVSLDGVMISKVTGFNARYVTQKGIGAGARVTVARRGDTIPGIVRVLKKGKPNYPPGPQVWDSERVNLLANDPVARHVLGLEFSLKTLGLKGVGPALAKKLVEAGYTSIADFKGKRAKHFERFGRGNAETLVRLAQTLFQTTWPRPLLMAASGIFPPGIGPERAAKVMANPDYLKTSSNMESRLVRDNLDAYLEFESNFKVDTEIVAADKVLVFSGFRNDKVRAIFQTRGYGVSERLTKTACLLVSSREDSVKVQQACKLKIPVLFVTADLSDDALIAAIAKSLKLGNVTG